MALRSELCADEARDRDEPLAATASRVAHWVLIEYGGEWPYDPLDAPIFAGAVRDKLAEQLRALPHSRLVLIRRPRTSREGPVTVFVGQTAERGSVFRRLELDGHPDLHDLDVAGALRDGDAQLDHPLLLVCTHGKRDRCCARYGQPLFDHLCSVGERGWIWQSSHVGGDRFAGNLVCLPEGLYFGRVDRAAADRVLTAYLGGRIDLDHYRGRSCYSFAAQAAELHVRRERGLDGLYDLRLRAARRVDSGRSIVFEAEVAGEVHEVGVEPRIDEEAYLTCRAEAPRPFRRYVAVGSRIS